jgi:polyhydroxyalkanoate synthase subunit PhaC
VPPTINKYYALDLAPGRSLVEYLVRGGQQVFVISWRNPDARHADWGLDTYVQAVLGALDAVQRVSGADRAAMIGACAGGIIASVSAAFLAATGQHRQLAAFGLLVTVLDTAAAGTVGALADRQLASAAKAMSRRRGYLDGRALAEVFAWLRPGDLVWNYWVNNYLLGKKPPAFDILFWNADTTRMSARLHGDFVDLAMDNKLVTPGALTIDDTPIDLSRITADAYLVAGIADHITPWENCYRSTQLLGGKSRFILSTSGHIAALVNPPDNPKARYQTGTSTPASPADWLAAAETEQGSWWPDMLAWLGGRSGGQKPAPEELGGGGLRPLIDAPGTYVFDT